MEGGDGWSNADKSVTIELLMMMNIAHFLFVVCIFSSVMHRENDFTHHHTSPIAVHTEVGTRLPSKPILRGEIFSLQQSS